MPSGSCRLLLTDFAAAMVVIQKVSSPAAKTEENPVSEKAKDDFKPALSPFEKDILGGKKGRKQGWGRGSLFKIHA